MIPLCIPNMEGNEWKYIKECLDTNWVSSEGSYVNMFEEKFREYIGTQASIVTMNGTAAITLALQILGIGAGDEVIVPSMTFIASVNPILYVGAEPVFADATLDTWVMDVNKIEALITNRTKAIMPVHVYGNIVDMEPLMELAKKHNIYVIEDATEALGSEYRTSDGKWHKAGTIGHIGTFSFNGNKLITTGAGGMLVTNDKVLGDKAKYLSNQAKTMLPNGAFSHEDIGYNYRMPNILAALGVAQLEKIHEHLQKKLEHAELYNSLLKNIQGIKLATQKDNVKHTQWLYGVLIDDEYDISRDELIKIMKDNNILSRPFFQPIHKMNPYINFKASDMSVTSIVTQNGISLPSSVTLTSEEIVQVCNIMKAHLKG